MTQLFLYMQKEMEAIEEKSLKRGERRYDKKRIEKILVFNGCSIKIVVVYDTCFSNRSSPILPFFTLLHSFSIFIAKARRKNCISMFRFPLVRNLLNL